MLLPNGEEVSPLIELAVLTPDYCIGLERYDAAITFVHCSVFAHWGPRLARDIRAATDRLSASHEGPLFAASDRPHGGDHAKFGKFVRLMGFEYFRTVRGTDGNDHAVFVRRR